MKGKCYRNRFPLVGFVLMVGVIIGVVGVYMVAEYRRMKERVEQSLVREGLSVIAAFEASVQTSLSGRSRAERLRELVRDTCVRADLAFFSFIDPTYHVYTVCATGAWRYYQVGVSNLYTILERQPYEWGYVRGVRGEPVLVVVKPLLLDGAEKVGKQ
ncbi:MAG: hypothetical protein N2595_06635, partial [bacterium]|nr:hypothetical protein [bacterium]